MPPGAGCGCHANAPSRGKLPNGEIARQLTTFGGVEPAKYDWHSPGLALVTVIIFELGDFRMMRKLLVGVRSRAERTAAAQPSDPAAAQTGILQP
jgi:hypothetical protein